MIGAYLEFGEYDKVWGTVDIPEDHPMYELGDGIDLALNHDFAGAVEAFEEVILNSDNPRRFMFDLIATMAMLAGDFETAREYAEISDPDFTADADPTIDRLNLSDIVRYAYILQKLGEDQRASSLLAAALPVARELPRMGQAGHGIRDVQILALQGKSFEALTALRESIDEGFRGTVPSNGWPMSLDPYLELIRGKPEFHAMANEIAESVDAMQERVNEAEATGNWETLRALTDSG